MVLNTPYLFFDSNNVQIFTTPLATGLSLFSSENSVTHANYAQAVADSNIGRSFIKTGDRNGSPWRKTTLTEYNTFPNSARFRDSGGTGNYWVADIDCGSICPEWLGASGDGTDDLSFLNDSVRVPAVEEVILSSRQYGISNTWRIPEDKTIRGLVSKSNFDADDSGGVGG